MNAVVPTFGSVSHTPSVTIPYSCSPTGGSYEVTRQPSERSADKILPGLVQFSQLVTTSTVAVVLAGFVQIVSSHERVGGPFAAGDDDEQAMTVGAVATIEAIAKANVRALPNIEER
jgi:hypothetical protein